LIIFGTSVRNYTYEALAIIVIVFGAVLAIFWEDIFKTKKAESKNKEE